MIDHDTQQQETARSSVKVAQTDNGPVFEVNVYAGDAEETIDETRNIAVRAYYHLRRQVAA